MIDFRERFESRNSDSEVIKEIDKHIKEVVKQAEELADFFSYVEKNNLGIDIIQPQINQINNYVTENLSRMEQLKNEFSNLSAEDLKRIEAANTVLTNIQNEINETQEIAEENGKTLDIAGSLD